MLTSPLSFNRASTRVANRTGVCTRFAVILGAIVLILSGALSAAERKAPNGLTGTQILEKSLAAKKKYSYKGRQTVEVKIGNRTLTYTLDVVHKAPNTEFRWYRTPEFAKDQRVLQTAKEQVQYTPGLRPQIWRFQKSANAPDIDRDMLILMRKNYKIEYQRMGKIAGRSTYVVNASPKWPQNGDPSQTRYIDCKTFVNLATVQFEPSVRNPGLLTDEQRRARQVSAERFDRIEFLSKIISTDMEIPSGGKFAQIQALKTIRVESVGDFAKHLDRFVPQTPMAMPPGYAMEEAIAIPDHPLGKGGQILFTNGVGVVMLVFTCPDNLEHRSQVLSMGVMLEDTVTPCLGSLKMTGKCVDETLYTLVANLDDESIRRLADSIDPSAEKRIIKRMSQSMDVRVGDIIELRQEGLGMQQTHIIIRISSDQDVPFSDVFRTYQKTSDFQKLLLQYNMEWEELQKEQMRLIGEQYMFTLDASTNK